MYKKCFILCVLSIISLVGMFNPCNTNDELTELLDILDSVLNSVVKVEYIGLSNGLFNIGIVEHIIGSGILISNDGLVLTCKHVVESGKSVSNVVSFVTFKDGSSFGILSSSCSIDSDLAIIKINGKHNRFISEIDANPRIGTDIWVIGCPDGLDFPVSSGIVSTNQVMIDDMNLIQIDAPVNPGNSGGPVINHHGKIVGIASHIKSPGEFSVGINFMVGGETIRKEIPLMMAGIK